MKKNFLKVAALLVVAMLMVVSCSQEITPNNEDNALVQAIIGLAYGKDVTVGYKEDTAITYEYKLTPQWTDLDNGAPIYGRTNDFVSLYDETKTITSNLSSVNLNYVTPGLWLVEVQGKVTVENVSKVVLKGSTKAYFNGSTSSSNHPTVYVSPVTDATAAGKVTITLLMEDLDAIDASDENTTSKIKYYLDNDTTGVTVDKVKKVNTSLTNKTFVNANEVHEYSVNINDVTSGYHTITFKVNNYDGGVTKSFLMIPGNDVTISGSIYPSKFIDSQSTIKVVTLEPVNLTINGTEISSGSVGPVEITASTEFSVSIADFAVPEGFSTSEMSYTWYIDGKKQNGSTKNVTLTTPDVPGDYTVSCIAMLQYTDDASQSYTLYGCEAFAGKVRVKAANNKVASATTPEATV